MEACHRPSSLWYRPDLEQSVPSNTTQAELTRNVLRRELRPSLVVGSDDENQAEEDAKLTGEE